MVQRVTVQQAQPLIEPAEVEITDVRDVFE